MPALRKISRVQARSRAERDEYAISNTSSSAGHVASCGAVERLAFHPTANCYLEEIHPRLTGQLNGGLFLYRLEPCSHRESYGRPAGEGMVRVERQPSPLNRCRSVVRLTKAGRCNSGRRDKASVGIGNHCARLLKSEATDRRLMYANANHLLNLLQGWFVLAPSLWLISTNRHQLNPAQHRTSTRQSHENSNSSHSLLL